MTFDLGFAGIFSAALIGTCYYKVGVSRLTEQSTTVRIVIFSGFIF